MATVYAPPKGIEFKYDYSKFNIEDYNLIEKVYADQLRAWCRTNSKTPSDELIGETISFPVADGYARYMVLNTKPLQLIHMEAGDSWNADPILLRGLRLSDVRKRLKTNKNSRICFLQSGKK